jgi:predicted MPP superfamily phosphohydrolase
VILWGGDFAETKEDARRLFGQIARLKPRLGMAGVVGNNDRRAFRGSMDEFRQLAERAGIKLLINERRTIPAPGGELTILGLDEDFYGAPDPSILSEKGREAGMSILLSHSPAPLEQLLNGRTPPDLILCGHTHGGQMRAVGLTLYNLGYEGVRPRLQRFFTVRGLKREEGSVLVVSGGLGSSKIPLRINCPPEMQLITLSRDEQAPSS